MLYLLSTYVKAFKHCKKLRNAGASASPRVQVFCESGPLYGRSPIAASELHHQNHGGDSGEEESQEIRCEVPAGVSAHGLRRLVNRVLATGAVADLLVGISAKAKSREIAGGISRYF